jgi:uncharacterized protein
MLDQSLKIAAAEIALPLSDVPEAQRISGTPRTGATEIGRFGQSRIGVWEITPGEMRDVEIDEVFVVLFGAGVIVFEDGSTATLAAGDVVRLHAGQKTIWKITSTLRKVYWAS